MVTGGNDNVDVQNGQNIDIDAYFYAECTTMLNPLRMICQNNQYSIFCRLNSRHVRNT